MRVLLIDNYDSFTFNLVHYLEQYEVEVRVVRNDEAWQEELDQADMLVLSPGPGLPKESGDLMQIIEYSVNRLPILGVCLGHQALGEHFGGELYNLENVHHGESTTLNIIDPDDILYTNVSQGSRIGHYHSWVIDKLKVPSDLRVTAVSLGDEIMSFKHKTLPIWGVQYHPESVLTEEGLTIIGNWVLQNKNGHIR